MKQLSLRAVLDVLHIPAMDSPLLEVALTHKSLSRESNNERLEFLGDSLFSTVVSHLLYEHCSSLSEGEMSMVRARLVGRETMAELARNAGLAAYVRAARGVDCNGDSILAGALEALIAVVYLERGYEAVYGCVTGLMSERLEELVAVSRTGPDGARDPKSALQEFSMRRYGVTPRYETIGVLGPEEARVFLCRVTLEAAGESETGRGKTRKKAEFAAAARLLARLRGVEGVDSKVMRIG